MKKLLLISVLIIIAFIARAELTSKSGNVLRIQENGKYHALIEIYDNASDSAVMIERFSVYIGSKLELAKDSIKGSDDKTVSETILELLEAIIIEESLNGGILKYKPDLDIKLIEELK